MDRLKERLLLAERAIGTLQELAGLTSPSAIERDACIQRFEYSFEAVWKAAKRYLNLIEGLDVASPKAVVRASLEVGLFDEQAARHAMVMADDRNLTVHTYNEQLAEQIMLRMPKHAQLMHDWIGAIRGRLSG